VLSVNAHFGHYQASRRGAIEVMGGKCAAVAFRKKSGTFTGHKNSRIGLVGLLVTIVIVEICHKSAVRLASIFQGLAWDIEEPITLGATAPYGDPTYRARYFEFAICHTLL
jgi:hypothetical protein